MANESLPNGALRCVEVYGRAGRLLRFDIPIADDSELTEEELKKRICSAILEIAGEQVHESEVNLTTEKEWGCLRRVAFTVDRSIPAKRGLVWRGLLEVYSMFGTYGEAHVDEGGFPVPSGWEPLTGHSVSLAQDFYMFLHDVAQQCGGICRLRFPKNRWIVVAEPEVAEQVLKETPEFSKHVPLGIGVIGELRYLAPKGLFTTSTSDPEWKKGHKILRPAFSLSRIREYVPKMWSIAFHLRDVFNALIEKGGKDYIEIDVKPWMTRMTLQAIAETMFSYDLKLIQEEPPVHPFVDSMNFALAESLRRVRRMSLKPFFVLSNLKYKEEISRMTKVVHEVIADRREKMAAGREVPEDMLQFMMKEKEEGGSVMDDDQIVDEIITFMIAGHDTTANLLAWALYCLWKNPDVETKLLQELDEATSSAPDETLSLERIMDLTYLGQVIKETLRLYPPAALIAKMCMKDDAKLCEYKASKGDRVTIPPYALHRNSKYWPDPETFDPERFAPANEKEHVKGSYLPFSGGVRSCIGQQFALAEAKIVLFVLLRNFKFSIPSHHTHVVHDAQQITMQPVMLRMAVSHRN